MKRVFKICLSLFISVFVTVLTVFSFSSETFAVANASTAVGSLSYSSFKTKVNSILIDFVKFTNRLAGSDGEKQASEYIASYLDNNTTLSARNDDYVVDGEQTFTFLSDFSSVYETSQNIIYEYVFDENSDNYVILGCHYDAVAYAEDSYQTTDDIVESESVTGSAGSVATLLALAEYLPNMNLNYNVQIVFFGAGESSNAGSSFFVQGISAEEKENILCMINFDNIAVGQNVYFYVDEVSNAVSELFEDVASVNGVQVEEVDTLHLAKTLLSEANEIGLSYTHLALQSDNYSFKKMGITSINYFAGDYSTGVVLGKLEYAGSDIVAYTANDNLDYISQTFGEDAVFENLFEVYKSVVYTLTDSDFVSTLSSYDLSSSWFYLIFQNPNLVFYLTVVAFLIFVMVAIYLHHKLTIKSYYANVETEFLSSVVKISEELDDQNGEVVQAVSKKLADDIKKNKMIKTKKKHKE